MKIKKIICAALASLCAFSCGCGGGRGGSKSVTDSLETSDASAFEGVHQVKAVKTQQYLIRNQQSDYSVILPEQATGKEFTAASELSLMLYRASGVKLDIVTEGSRSPAKFISVGRTQLFSNSEITAGADLGQNGYRIADKGGNVFICGGGDTGTLNGVYGFLELTAGFGVYAPDEVQVTMGDVSLYELDVTEVPDIQYRVGDVTTKIDGDESYRMRLKYNCNDDAFLYAKGSLYHNSLVYFPKDDYSGAEYRDFYSENNGSTDYLQLCYTAHGKGEKLQNMLGIAADIIVETAKQSSSETVTFMQSDVNSWCSCPTCSAEKEKYGTDSAVVVKFLNLLSDKVYEKFETEGMTDRKIEILFFAYQRTEKAPAVKNADGCYRPADESVVCRDNVSVFYAPIYANYQRSFYDPQNASEAETLKAWKSVCSKTSVWLYQTNFSHYLYPYNSLPTMQERYRFLAEQGAQFLFDQNQWDQKVKTSFHRLKAWMGAKLSWNVNADYDALLDEYFTGYFGAAAEPMRALFDGITYRMSDLSDHFDLDGGIYYSINQSRFFPKPMLDGWMERIDEAYASIAGLAQSDPDGYRRIENRIRLESISVQYMILDLYAGRFSPEVLKKMQTEFMNDCFKLGVDMDAELVNLSKVFGGWGLI